jgi:UDP-N-acetylmuramoyl-L-alanyl-D-glutamate--2,6-diaminopimelate ligase
VHVKGRIELVPVSSRYTLMIDYAHNAMALESLLTTLRAYEPGRLVCLFGCGGNRAKSRRYEMGEVSSRLADLTVVTSDNPRNEEPMDIIEDILTGVKKADGAYVTIPDRKEAIAYCMLHAQDGDIIVLAGKGHEDYQEIRGVKHHMDERELIGEIRKEHPELN